MRIENYAVWLRLISHAACSRRLELNRQAKPVAPAHVSQTPARDLEHLDGRVILRRILFVGLVLMINQAQLPRRGALAQEWFGGPPATATVPTTSTAQRNALSNVRMQVNWLQNATRSASSYGNAGADMIQQQFQQLRAAYGALVRTLNQRQLDRGANELAELSAGLDIIQETFANYHDDIASGRAVFVALNDLSQVLREASGLWLQELNRDCSRLQIG